MRMKAFHGFWSRKTLVALGELYAHVVQKAWYKLVKRVKCCLNGVYFSVSFPGPNFLLLHPWTCTGSEEIGLKPRQQMAPLYAYLLLAAAVSIWLCRHQISRIFFCSPNKPALDWAKTRLPAKWSSHFPTLSGLPPVFLPGGTNLRGVFQVVCRISGRTALFSALWSTRSSQRLVLILTGILISVPSTPRSSPWSTLESTR